MKSERRLSYTSKGRTLWRIKRGERDCCAADNEGESGHDVWRPLNSSIATEI